MLARLLSMTRIRHRLLCHQLGACDGALAWHGQASCRKGGENFCLFCCSLPSTCRVLDPSILEASAACRAPCEMSSEHWVSATGSVSIYLVLYLLSGATVECLHSVLFKHCPLKCLWSRHLTLLEDVLWVCFQSPFAAPSLFCCEYRPVCFW